MYIHKEAKKNLIISLSDMKNTALDMVIVICGWEGWGESFMARGIAKFCADFLGSTFGVEDIYFDLNDYIKGSLNGGRFKINVLDEARKVLNKRRAMSRDVVKFTNYLSECRSKQQVHIICVPSYSDLDRYVVAWRLNMLFCIDKEYLNSDETESGYTPRFGTYRLFVSKKALIYNYDRGYNYYPSKYEARDKWTSVEVFSKEELEQYQANKDKATMQKYMIEDKEKVSRDGVRLKSALIAFKDYTGLTHKEIAERAGLPLTTYQSKIKEEIKQ